MRPKTSVFRMWEKFLFQKSSINELSLQRKHAGKKTGKCEFLFVW
jgi:hypothetical protein